MFRLLMLNLDRPHINVFLLVLKGKSSESEADDARENEENTYDA